MLKKKTALAIVNRAFWPKSQTIGEGLLQFAELFAASGSVSVITQSDDDLVEVMAEAKRGKSVRFSSCRAYTDSASSVPKRVFESIVFMSWTFANLARYRPAVVYVSTNPPVTVPFIVMLYCKLFRARYIYHLQDIHPEAANIVVPVNQLMYRFFVGMDNVTLRNADSIITLSSEMKAYIKDRSATSSPIHLLNNPSLNFSPTNEAQPKRDIVFCGNAGRLQRIPLIISAIREYLEKGGNMSFSFAGGGIYASNIHALAKEFDQVAYHGVVTATEAAELVNAHQWAFLPIVDEATRYAFPSKSSGYALSGVGVIAVCGSDTSVARWTRAYPGGVVCAPDIHELVKTLFSLEQKRTSRFQVNDSMRESLQMSYFASELCRLAGECDRRFADML